MEENSLIAALNLQPSDRIISVHENGLADANFILTNLMKKIFNENGKVCLVILHNTIGHYHNVLKRLGHDFVHKVKSGTVACVEHLKDISSRIGRPDFPSSDKEAIVKTLFLEINDKISSLLDGHLGKVYLIIDDLSHLADLGVGSEYISSFVNCCVNATRNDQVHVIINCHVSDECDQILSNSLRYVSNLAISVSPLKTGISHDVTGVININRRQSNELPLRNSTLHYKAYDREIRTFAPGESIYHLYK